MAYATTTDLAAYGLPASVLAGIASGDQTRALAAASSKLDGFLASRYAVPLTSYGTDVTQCVCAWAAAELMFFVGYRPDGSDQTVIDRSERWDAWALNVSKGHIHPSGGVTTPAAQPEGRIASGVFSVTSSSQRGW